MGRPPKAVAKKAHKQHQVSRGGNGRRKAAIKPAARKDKSPEIAMRRNAPVDNESKKLFLDDHLPKIARLKAMAHTAASNLRNAYKSAKKDGFLQRDFDVAFRLKTEIGEKQIKAGIARDMTIAKWLGYGLGKQLDLFVETEEHDIEATAYADGEEASRTGKPAAPIYAPETAGYEAYMRGFHDHQEELHKGFKTTEEPSSGVAMTRSQFKVHQRATNIAQAADAAEERSSLFSKRSPPETAA
jgi:hypothetical protein